MKTAAVFFTASFIVSAIAASSGDAQRGRKAFEQTCTGCHALDRVRVGPRLRNVYGLPAGKDSQFSYSDALKGASVTWNETTLDRWLADPEGVVPGNDMSFRLSDATKRADIIAYLQQLSEK